MEENLDLKIKLKELLIDSTIHGIPRVLKSKSLTIKLIWILCFFISTSYCIILVIEAVNIFLDYEAVTNINTYSDASSNTFPAITFCNLNQFQNENSLNLVRKYANLSSLYNYQKSIFLFNELFESNDSYKKSISNSFNETLIKCTIKSNKCSSYQFEWFFHLVYGNCFRFNTGREEFGEKKIDLEKLSRTGYQNGLRIELFTGNTLFMPSFIETMGFHVFINNQSAAITLSEGFDIATNTETNIGITKVFTKKLPSPYSNCYGNLVNIDDFDSEPYRALISSQKTYNQNQCFDLCYQLYKSIGECGCYNAGFYRFNSTVSCSTSKTTILCNQAKWEDFLNYDLNEQYSQYCPLECESIKYQVISLQKIIIKLYSKILKQKF